MIYILTVLLYLGVVAASYADLTRQIEMHAPLYITMSIGACTGVLFAVLCLYAGTQMYASKPLPQPS